MKNVPNFQTKCCLCNKKQAMEPRNILRTNQDLLKSPSTIDKRLQMSDTKSHAPT